jgi:quercetin dioxygenase-like cupin family protein
MHRALLGIVVLGLVLAVGGLLGARRVDGRAQGGATPPPGPSVTTEVLGQNLPTAAPGQSLWLLRVTFAPGAAAGAHTHPGATVYYIDSGTLVFTLQEGSATVTRATDGDATPAAEAVAHGAEVVLNAGDWVAYAGDAVQLERNDGAEPAVILISNLRGEDEPARLAHEHATPAS